uniref:Putative cell growth-regulating nucleolar protein n=1 Tax=Ixodes ricinus TaxID=34613 RepID=A0A131Y9A4_IXORI
MVVFACNACGDALKKNQVEKHYLTKCRSCEVLTCLDCNKEFWGDDYKAHIKCITEQERYGGKGVKSPVFKGEAKQEEWIEMIAGLITREDMSPRVRDIFKRMQSFNNIPRKAKPFKNFLKSSMCVSSEALAEEVWQTIQKAQQPKPEQPPKRPRDDSQETVSNNVKQNADNGSPAKKSKPQDEENGSAAESASKRFKWKKTLKAVLRDAEDQQLSLKKLRKKVFAEYRSQGGQLVEEGMQAKFLKVLGNTSYFEEVDGKVRLVHS